MTRIKLDNMSKGNKNYACAEDLIANYGTRADAGWETW